MEHKISENKLIEIYCFVDECVKILNEYYAENLAEHYYVYKSGLSMSEMITIQILYHLSGYKTFEYFYNSLNYNYLHNYFPNIPNIKSFYERQKKTSVYLIGVLLMKISLSKKNGIYYIDSTKIEVCKASRMSRNKVFLNYAKKSKTSTDTAFVLAEDLYKFAEQKGHIKGMADAAHYQGITYDIRANFPKALEYFFKSIDLKRKINDKLGIGVSLNSIGVINNNIGDFDQSLKYFTEAYEIFLELNDKKNLGNCFNNFGIVYYAQGNYDKAIENYNKSMKFRLELNDMRSYAASINNIAMVYYNKGEHAKALQLYQEALKIRKEINDKYGMGSTLMNMGLVYEDQGDLEKSINLYQESLKIRKELNDLRGIAACNINLSTALTRLGNDSLAFVHVLESKEALEKMRDKRGIAAVLVNLANNYLVKKNYTRAIELNLQSLKITEEIGEMRIRANACNSLSNIYFQMNEYNLSKNYAFRAFNISDSLGIHDDALKANRMISKNYSVKNQLDSLYVFVEKFRQSRLEELDNNYFVLSEREKELYFASIEEDFSHYFDYVVHQKDKNSSVLDSAFNTILITKGLTLKSTTALRTSILTSKDTSLIQDYEKWIKLKRKVSKFYSQGKTSLEAESEASELEKSLVSRSNVFSEFNKIKNLNWKNIQSKLKPGECAIEFFEFTSYLTKNYPRYYAAMIVKPESKHPEVVKLCSYHELDSLLKSNNNNKIKVVENIYGKKNQKNAVLYDKIWKPMEPIIGQAKKIYFSPAGLLHKISFSAINKDKNLYLSDQYQFRQLSSTGNLATTKNENITKEKPFFVLGGVKYTKNNEQNVWSYLPGTLEESKNIVKILENNKFKTQSFYESNATEENVKQYCPQSQVVHFATHGFFFPEPNEENINPVETKIEEIKFRGSTNYANWSFINNKNPLMRSGLVLANANEVWDRDPSNTEEDGILTAQEVIGMDLNQTVLVVLSACETGLGEIKGAEGVFGLQRAFKIAGANYLIISLWQVSDKETSEFMQIFYGYLASGKLVPEAFELTQKQMKSKYDPFYWASFVLVK